MNLRKFLRDEGGQDRIMEYVLLAAAGIIVVVAAVIAYRNEIVAAFEYASSILRGVR